MSAGRTLKRAALLLGIAVLALVAASPWIMRQLGGAWSREAVDPDGWSPTAAELIAAARSDLDPARVFDFHVHLLGVGAGGTGAWLNPRLTSWLHPVDHARFTVFMSAAGITDLARADQQYLERFVSLVQSSPIGGRYLLLPFDWRYEAATGRQNPSGSEFYVPNSYALQVTQDDPMLQVGMSVHPYRPDALEALEAAAADGAWVVKWLPNAMGIDPADARCFPYYERMAELGLVLISHGGAEKAVHAEEDQELGNPLRLRAALDRGVRVVVAHCASSGSSRDLDEEVDSAAGAAEGAQAESADEGPQVSNFELFLRLMDEARYEHLLWGEISAITQVNRFPETLVTLLAREDLHGRLVNGSDYPLPGVNVLFSTLALERAGFLSEAERDALNEIYDRNPLLFDLVLKRTVRHPQRGTRFPAAVFELPPDLDRTSAGRHR